MTQVILGHIGLGIVFGYILAVVTICKYVCVFNNNDTMTMMNSLMCYIQTLAVQHCYVME